SVSALKGLSTKASLPSVLSTLNCCLNSQLFRPLSLPIKSITKGDRFQFDPNSIFNRNHRTRFEDKRRQHRAELVDRRGIVAIQHHIASPVAHPNHEQFDLEIFRGLPLPENLQNPLLSVLVFYR